MEFMLNVIFFLVMPCIIICDTIKKIKIHFKGLDRSTTDKSCNKSSKKCFSSRDMQVYNLSIKLLSTKRKP